MKSEGKYQKNKIFCLIDNHALRINVKLAEEIGLEESIVLLQIEYLLGITNNAIEGKKWIYCSAQELKEKYFGFWSISTIRRILESLRASDYIIVANFNKRKYDRTKWFTLNLEKISKLKSISIDGIVQNEQGSEQGEQGESQSEQPIPKTSAKTSPKDYILPSCKNEIFAGENNFFRDIEKSTDAEKRYHDYSVERGDREVYYDFDDGKGLQPYKKSGLEFYMLVAHIVKNGFGKLNASSESLWNAEVQIKAIEDMITNPKFGFTRMRDAIATLISADRDIKNGFNFLFDVPDADTPLRIKHDIKRIEKFKRKKWNNEIYCDWHEETYPEYYENEEDETEEECPDTEY